MAPDPPTQVADSVGLALVFDTIAYRAVSFGTFHVASDIVSDVVIFHNTSCRSILFGPIHPVRVITFDSFTCCDIIFSTVHPVTCGTFTFDISSQRIFRGGCIT